MIYNFNLGIGWASSGVEYAQAYRAKMLRNIHQPAKFIFTDMFPQDPLAHMTANIGLLDEEVIWLYTFFTDCKTAPVSFTLSDLEQTFSRPPQEKKREGKVVRYLFEGKNNFYTAYLTDANSDLVHRVEMVSHGYLIRKDYFTYCRNYSEYYAPLDNKAHLYMRRFFHEDGRVAYEEMVDGKRSVFRFPHRMFFSKEELVGYMVEQLNLTEDDVVIIDRTTGIGQSILQNVKNARIGLVIHADHFSENSTNEVNILWNNYYEYSFAQHKHIDFYITATDVQNKLLREQFQHYLGVEPTVVTIPVGSIQELKFPKGSRKKHSVITASRLAPEKHVDWVIDAVVEAKATVDDLTLDIYGKGVEEFKLVEQIQRLGCQDYVRLMGQQNLTEVYQNYEVYLAASTSEGFGLTLLEAVGAGLPIIGFDVRYGNQAFIESGKNGVLIPIEDSMDHKDKVHLLAEALVKLCTQMDMEECHKYSYQKAKEYMTEEVEKKWDMVLHSSK